jgi:hypothetical protein
MAPHSRLFATLFVAIATALGGACIEGRLPSPPYGHCEYNWGWPSCLDNLQCESNPLRVDRNRAPLSFCSKQCRSDSDCPNSGACVDTGSSHLCYPRCRPDLTCDDLMLQRCLTAPSGGASICVWDNTSFKWLHQRCDGPGDQCLMASCLQANASAIPNQASRAQHCSTECTAETGCPRGGPTAWGNVCVVRAGVGQCYELCERGSVHCQTPGFECVHEPSVGRDVCLP